MPTHSLPPPPTPLLTLRLISPGVSPVRPERVRYAHYPSEAMLMSYRGWGWPSQSLIPFTPTLQDYSPLETRLPDSLLPTVSKERVSGVMDRSGSSEDCYQNSIHLSNQRFVILGRTFVNDSRLLSLLLLLPRNSFETLFFVFFFL